MQEFLQACIALVNLPYTVMLILVVVYWLSVILGLFHHDFHVDGDLGGGFHGGADIDSGVHIETDVAGHADGGSHIDGPHGAAGGFWERLPFFFNLGGSPLTVFFSFFFLGAWIISMSLNHFLGNSSMGIAILLFFPNALASLLVARIASSPFAAVFRALSRNHPDHQGKLIGKVCTIVTSRVDQEFGRGEVKTHGAPHLLDVRTREGITLKSGDQALIIIHEPDKNVYIVQPYECEKINSDPEGKT